MKNKKRLVISVMAEGAVFFGQLYYAALMCQLGPWLSSTKWKLDTPQVGAKVGFFEWGIFLSLFLFCLIVSSYTIIMDEANVTVKFLYGLISRTYSWCDFKYCHLIRGEKDEPDSIVLSIHQTPSRHWMLHPLSELEFENKPALYGLLQIMTPHLMYPVSDQIDIQEGALLGDIELLQNRREYNKNSKMFVAIYLVLSIIIMMEEILWLDAVLTLIWMVLYAYYLTSVLPKLQKLNDDYYTAFFMSMKK